MRNSIQFLIAALMSGMVPSVANAQFVVTDPGADALLSTIIGEVTATNSQLGVANSSLQRIAASTQATATTTANTLTMFQTPTPVVGVFSSIDAGGAAEAASDAAEYMPHLAGASATSATAGTLVAAEDLAVTTDELKGIATGNPAKEQAERQRRIATNLQGEAYADLIMYGKRYIAADTLLPTLSTLNLKQAVVYGAGLQLQIIKQLNLLGQSMSMNTAAVAESWLQTMKIFFRLSEDHNKTALLF